MFIVHSQLHWPMEKSITADDDRHQSGAGGVTLKLDGERLGAAALTHSDRLLLLLVVGCVVRRSLSHAVDAAPVVKAPCVSQRRLPALIQR